MINRLLSTVDSKLVNTNCYLPYCLTMLSIVDSKLEHKLSYHWYILLNIVQSTEGSRLMSVICRHLLTCLLSTVDKRNLKVGIRSLFDSCVNTIGRRPYWPSHVEVSYCTFGFDMIIRHDQGTSSLPRDSLRNNLCVRDEGPLRKGKSR